GGMDYKGFNIAVHEMGHNVEQILSLEEIDHTLLHGVPNTAFTEALAFVFQDKDLELLGLTSPDAKGEALKVLDDFWASCEIAGFMYLPDYPIGHLIAFQVKEQMKKAGKIGPEFERMVKAGRIAPDLWMTNATGKPVGPEALLTATEKALGEIK